MHAGRRGVDGQLADGDVHAVGAPVADAEEPLAVGGHDQVDVVGAQAVVAQGRLDAIHVVDGQVDALGPAELGAVALDRLRHDRGVDDREHLLQVLLEQLVEEDLVALAHGGQECVAGEVVGLDAVLRIRAPRLSVERQDGGRQQPLEAERRALLGGERGPAVEARIAQQGAATGQRARDRGIRHFISLVPLRSAASPSGGQGRRSRCPVRWPPAGRHRRHRYEMPHRGAG